MYIKQSCRVVFELCEGSNLRITAVILYSMLGILLYSCIQGGAGSSSVGVIGPAFAPVTSYAPTPIPAPTLAPVASAAFDSSKLPDRQQRAFPTSEGFGAASKGNRVDLLNVASYDMGQIARQYFSMLQKQSPTSSGVSPAEDERLHVLSLAGAFPCNPLDQRVVDDPSEVGGWPTLASASAYMDTNGNGDGYTHLEEFLNELAGDQDTAGNLLSKAGTWRASVPLVNCGLRVA